MAIRVLIQMRDLRVGNGIAACIMNYYEYTVKHGYQIDFLLNRNIDSPYAETVKKMVVIFIRSHLILINQIRKIGAI